MCFVSISAIDDQNKEEKRRAAKETLKITPSSPIEIPWNKKNNVKNLPANAFRQNSIKYRNFKVHIILYIFKTFQGMSKVKPQLYNSINNNRIFI